MSLMYRGESTKRLLEPAAATTVANAFLSGAMAVGLGADEIAVYTSWWHAPRTRIIWRRWRRTHQNAPPVTVHSCRSASVYYIPREIVSLLRILRDACLAWVHTRARS